jgi:steroid delta-isomerase-like uncharacterized protein
VLFEERVMPELDDRNLAVLGEHVAAESVFDMAATLATLTDDCLFEDMPSLMRYRGREAVNGYYRSWWDAFRNVPEGRQRYAVSKDCLIAETRFIGRHVGPYKGIAPGGRPIDLPVAIFVNFRDGLMSGERFYYDEATLLRQIRGE